jgi:hypothetical protein
LQSLSGSLARETASRQPDLAGGMAQQPDVARSTLFKKAKRRDSEVSQVSSVGSVDGSLTQHNTLFEVGSPHLWEQDIKISGTLCPLGR